MQAGGDPSEPRHHSKAAPDDALTAGNKATSSATLGVAFGSPKGLLHSAGGLRRGTWRAMAVVSRLGMPSARVLTPVGRIRRKSTSVVGLME